MLPSLVSLPLVAQTKTIVPDLPGGYDADYNTSVQEAIREAAQKAVDGRVRIEDEELLNLGLAAIKRFYNYPISKEYSFRRKADAFDPVKMFLRWEQSIQNAYAALLNAMMPLNITNALVLIMAYSWLNANDANASISNYDAKRMLTKMKPWEQDETNNSKDWWLAQVDAV